ncbi:uncharacterized protein LOC34619266 [Cyclospora cayetanensis]|uniref:RNA polymerase n=2 Tax=Cyclospora cayetanensis TaxID=88456 RepID=A0A1D3D964_9EIME|nr:uncharacterized protein LOC34619266 [Cyclospora cayetanensis]OEH80006.1 putative RNA polymerase [Cyclospora cayetanensis]
MPVPSAKAVRLAQCAEGLCLPLGDAEACRSLVMQDLQQLDDCVEFLVLGHKVKGDSTDSSGPPRLKYEAPGKAAAAESQAASHLQLGREEAEGSSLPPAVAGGCTLVSKNGVSFDWLVALGCLNCGAPISLRRDLVGAAEGAAAAAKVGASEKGSQEALLAAAEKAVLKCRHCGHDIAPLHSSEESESLVDRMDDQPACRPGLAAGGVYLFGSRRCYNFGTIGKKSWQQRFLGAEFEQQRLQHHLKIMLAAGEGGGGKAVCKETCEKCGHHEAFFSTFQARSADEGMTVMYECTKCHHRRVFNN